MAKAIGNTKFCPKCKSVLGLEAFGKDGKRSDGLKVWCRGCTRAAGRRYISEHKDEHRARAYEWRRQNPEAYAVIKKRAYRNNIEAVREYTRAYYEKNAERLRAKTRQRYAELGELMRAQHRAWCKANRKQLTEYSKAYRRANKDKVLLWWKVHTQRRRAAPGRYSQKDIVTILCAQRWRCAYCRTSVRGGYHVDHIMPLALGGTNNPSNLQVACPTCNAQKGARNPADFARSIGFLL